MKGAGLELQRTRDVRGPVSGNRIQSEKGQSRQLPNADKAGLGA